MKTTSFLIALYLSVSTLVMAQQPASNASNKPAIVQKSASTKTETFLVGGKCDMCKARIEKTAKVAGVSKADWNKQTKKLTLTYDPSKVKVSTVQKALAAVGHDAGPVKADDAVYAKLPGCCKYR
jgi:copper chaperone CopZ